MLNLAMAEIAYAAVIPISMRNCDSWCFDHHSHFVDCYFRFLQPQLSWSFIPMIKINNYENKRVNVSSSPMMSTSGKRWARGITEFSRLPFSNHTAGEIRQYPQHGKVSTYPSGLSAESISYWVHRITIAIMNTISGRNLLTLSELCFVIQVEYAAIYYTTCE